MKFIISKFSPTMIIPKDFDLKWHELTEAEFQAIGYDGYSCIGQKDIADATGFAYNKEPVRARANDILLLAQYTNNGLLFYCIQIVESSTPLLREDEIEYIEEMI